MWVTAAYVLQAGDVSRRHVETAGFLFAAVLLAGAFMRRASDTPATNESLRPLGVRLLPGALYLSVAFALYWPSLGVGLLSDDFVLLDAAHRGDLTPPDWRFFRPLPLAVWMAVAAVSGDAAIGTSLHALNIALHAANALLVALVGRRFGLGAVAAASAGALFLVFPGNVEAVTWVSGVFDLVLATCVLSAVMIALEPGMPARFAIAAMTVIAIAALATKETGVVLPLIVLASVHARWGVRRALSCAPAMAALLCVAIYIAVRLWRGLDVAGFPALTGYTAKELLVRPYAALGLPFHQAFVEHHRSLAVFAASLTPGVIFVSSSGWRARVVWMGRTTGLAIWMLLAVLPLFTSMFVGADLQGARYLYVSSAAWALLLTAVIDRWPGSVTAWRVGIVSVCSLAIIYAFAASWHQQTWHAAAAARDRVLETISTEAVGCAAVSVAGVPDQWREHSCSETACVRRSPRAASDLWKWGRPNAT